LSGNWVSEGIYAVCILWIVMELSFYYLLRSVVHPKLQPLGTPLPCPVDPVECIFRVMDSIDALKSYSIESYLSGFFRGAKFEDIYHENIRSFLSWAMYVKYVPDLTDEEYKKVDTAYQEVFSRHPILHLLKKGFNPKIKHVAFNLEPVPFIHRPLFLYILMGLVEFFSTALFLRRFGFQCLNMKGNTYWYRQGNSMKEPMLFFHGISSGWAFYTHLIKQLGKDRTIVLVDLEATKIKSLAFTMPTPAKFTEIVASILKRHHIEKVSVVGHSFGTISAGWIVSLRPDLVSHVTLMDPVSLLLALPDVAYNFLYRVPSNMVEWLIFFNAAREITISNMLHRHFSWYRNILWLEDIPPEIGVVVGTASKDEITSPYSIQEYVANCRSLRVKAIQAAKEKNEPVDIAMIEGIMWDGYSHGQILMGGAEHDAFIRLVNNSEKIFGTGKAF